MIVNLENVKEKLCVVCDRALAHPRYEVCLKCGRPCSTKIRAFPGEKTDLFLGDGKSDCCGADIRSYGTITCSTRCHDVLIKEWEKEFGVYKKVVSEETGVAYSVPVRDIIERGLRAQDLPMYPKWGSSGIA